MDFFTNITDRISAIRAVVGDVGSAEELPALVGALGGDTVVSLLRQTAEIGRAVEQLNLVAAGVIAQRSRRDAGQSGLAQSHGHRSSALLIQDVTGSSKADAARQVRVGEALVAVASSSAHQEIESATDLGDASVATVADAAPTAPWDAPLAEAVFGGVITAQQHDAIRRGLGEPPAPETTDSAYAVDREGAADADSADDMGGAVEAWRLAASHLVAEAAHRTVEELRAAARTIRDSLDPEGAEARFTERYEARSFRMWIDETGRRRGSISFDDMGGASVDHLMAAGLRPRRGGPRFVDAEEAARAQKLIEDRRTNDQLAYDLLLDVLGAGIVADAETVFGVRQAGVRLVQQIDRHATPAGPALTEDGLTAIPAAAAAQRICDTGTTRVTVDRAGNPLDVGREHRLFTPRQRIALAIRDGGCRWTGCDRPASYCEAHHIDPYSEGGRTDIDRGILLCRFHHMQLHHGDWRIHLHGRHEFRLRHRGGEEHELKPRAVLSYAWVGIDPPPKRVHPVA